MALPSSFLHLPHSLPLSHLSPLCLQPVLKCDAVSRCKQSSVTGACNSRMVAILAWTLTVVAVTSDGESGSDRRWQADEEEEEEEDRYSTVPSKCTLTTASLYLQTHTHRDTTHMQTCLSLTFALYSHVRIHPYMVHTSMYRQKCTAVHICK